MTFVMTYSYPFATSYTPGQARHRVELNPDSRTWWAGQSDRIRTRLNLESKGRQP
ncbi:hypothetical protein [Gordonia soli]|uniref:Uncharacterized protein n=1 Tax=Gordonia soli NBRC 108243 TaxID=1223545 RepID=M0QR03_9ACTN|nr:hypothetical protein [Gordonia soli]GAC70819.1 hypothetical protein GS4_41_00690 [Gordonia soli NBRC 108243]